MEGFVSPLRRTSRTTYPEKKIKNKSLPSIDRDVEKFPPKRLWLWKSNRK